MRSSTTASVIRHQVINLPDFQQLLQWSADHPGLVIGAGFLLAFFEALALVGIVVPGILLLFLLGALVGWDLPLLAMLVLAVMSGAVAGDGLSFWVGYRNRGRLRDRWPFARRAHWLDLGEQFFIGHGGKSIFIARFIGPLRPVLPLVAGSLGMPPAIFRPAACAARRSQAACLCAVGAADVAARGDIRRIAGACRRIRRPPDPVAAGAGGRRLVADLDDAQHLRGYCPPVSMVVEEPGPLAAPPSAAGSLVRRTCRARRARGGFGGRTGIAAGGLAGDPVRRVAAGAVVDHGLGIRLRAFRACSQSSQPLCRSVFYCHRHGYLATGIAVADRPGGRNAAGAAALERPASLVAGHAGRLAAGADAQRIDGIVVGPAAGLGQHRTGAARRFRALGAGGGFRGADRGQGLSAAPA